MLRLHGLDQPDPAFFFGDRVVQRAARHHVHRAGGQIDDAAAFILDLQVPAHDEEQLVFADMVVPHEPAAHLRDFDVLIVDLRDHLGRPVFGYVVECGFEIERFGERNGGEGHLVSRGEGCCSEWEVLHHRARMRRKVRL
ncbi:hypothetical protein BvRS1_27460 [Burkholderia vietnamiensis]|nr:hypothetical protein BvRS1_27460 [Burkholderia vietnamiensis]